METRASIGAVTWANLALVLFLAGYTGFALAGSGHWFGALLLAAIFPLGGIAQWWFMRRNAGPEAARAHDQNLITIMVAQLLFAMLTIWR